MAKILIVQAGFGEGHKKAAQAIGEHFGISPCDLLDFSSPAIKIIYSLSYLVVTAYFPGLWQTLFLRARKRRFNFWLNAVHRVVFGSFRKYLREIRPEIIIATHFFPASLASELKPELDFRIISVITDLRAHPLWVNSQIDYYFAALDITQNDLLRLGVPAGRIITGFVPVRKGFLEPVSQVKLNKKFSWEYRRPAVAFIASLRGNFSFLRESIGAILNHFNVFVIYGRNRRLKHYLQNLASPQVKFFRFYEPIWEIFALSAVIIGKPGGLTVFEGIYQRKPFIFTHYIPGQEKENMDLLIKCGVARFVADKTELIEAIHYFEEKSGEFQKEYPLEVKDICPRLDVLIRELDHA